MFKHQGTREAVGELGLGAYGNCLFRHVTKLSRRAGAIPRPVFRAGEDGAAR